MLQVEIATGRMRLDKTAYWLEAYLSTRGGSKLERIRNNLNYKPPTVCAGCNGFFGGCGCMVVGDSSGSAAAQAEKNILDLDSQENITKLVLADAILSSLPNRFPILANMEENDPMVGQRCRGAASEVCDGIISAFNAAAAAVADDGEEEEEEVDDNAAILRSLLSMDAARQGKGRQRKDYYKIDVGWPRYTIVHGDSDAKPFDLESVPEFLGDIGLVMYDSFLEYDHMVKLALALIVAEYVDAIEVDVDKRQQRAVSRAVTRYVRDCICDTSKRLFDVEMLPSNMREEYVMIGTDPNSRVAAVARRYIMGALMSVVYGDGTLIEPRMKNLINILQPRIGWLGEKMGHVINVTYRAHHEILRALLVKIVAGFIVVD